MCTLPLSTAPLALNGLLYPARKITLYGRSAARLSYRYAAESACERDKSPIFLVGDNRFDVYAIARYARSQNQSQERVLNRILVARAFTGHQLVELIRRLDPDKISGAVIISGICSAFLDQDLTDNEAARLYYRLLARLKKLADAGTALLLTETAEIAETRRAYFLTSLFQESNFVFYLDGEQTYTLEMKSYRPISYVPPSKAILP
ncbi:MAG TPA: hypothetical protein VJ302_10940 [Blastocatellia bacterium]|nr:hypothetical protein [Blastocatellia bacterium]